MPPRTRPLVFVGSSKESLKIASALQANLDDNAEVILWSQGVFGLSESSLESLVRQASESDFAVLLITADDLTSSGDNLAPSPRDNVIFELGLFMGTVGRTRTFIVRDRTAKVKLPSDLAGVTAAEFEPPSAGTWQSALGACCNRLRDAIQEQGPRARSGAEPPIDSNAQFRVIADLMDRAALQFIILMHEEGIALRREGPFESGPRHEYFLRLEHRHEAGQGSFQVGALCERLADADLLTIDLRGRVGLSQRGHEFAEWLGKSGYRAAYFWSDVGSWGQRPADIPARFEVPAKRIGPARQSSQDVRELRRGVGQ